MSDFKIKPKHWYQWINPFWWRQRKLMQAVLDYQWEQKRMKEKVQKAVTDSVLYGEGKVSMDWNEPSR